MNGVTPSPWTSKSSAVAESGIPGEARLVRHHGRNTQAGSFTRLANGTLDDATAPAERFAETPKGPRKYKVHLVRYADDFLITGTSKELLRDQVQPLVVTS